MRTSWDKIDLAWAAGFFDGEGNVSVKRHNNYTRANASIAQVDRRVLDKFVGIVGFGKVYGPYQPRTPNSHEYYALHFTRFWEIQQLGVLLWDNLGLIKKDQFRTALKFHLEKRQKWQICAAKGHKIRIDARGGHSCSVCYYQRTKLKKESEASR